MSWPRLFEEPQADWYIKAPEVSKGGGLISSFLPTKDLYYLLTAGICFPRRPQKTELVNIRLCKIKRNEPSKERSSMAIPWFSTILLKTAPAPPTYSKS